MLSSSAVDLLLGIRLATSAKLIAACHRGVPTVTSPQRSDPFVRQFDGYA
jgi:hypothetical protein